MHRTTQRAQLLMQQLRFAEAEQELRRALAEAPESWLDHALLGLCLSRLNRHEEAQQEVEHAILLAPDVAFNHYARSRVLMFRKRFSDAEQSVREALRLEPEDADYWAQLAVTLQYQGNWKGTLDAALQGLSHQADHEGCESMRTIALTKLGRIDQALDSVDETLSRNPENAFAHANKGWSLLHQRQSRLALESFREALRLDPNLQHAQSGMVEALKARNPIYRAMLTYFLWMSSLGSGARWGVILGGYLGARFLQSLARQQPALTVWITPILILYLVFVMLTWFAVPLFNLLLRFNRYGAYALTADQRKSSNWFAICLAVGVVGVIIAVATDNVIPLFASLLALGLALPLVTIHNLDQGWPRNMMMCFAAAMAGCGALGLLFLALDNPIASTFFWLFFIGFIATPWLANGLAQVTVPE